MATASLHLGTAVLNLPSTSAPSCPAAALQHNTRSRRPGAGAAPPLFLQQRRFLLCSPPSAAQHPGGQSYRFRYDYLPDKQDPLGQPRSERDAGDAASPHAREWTDADPVRPEDFWQARVDAGSLALPNPDAQRFRIKQVRLSLYAAWPRCACR